MSHHQEPVAAARADLEECERSQPDNFYESDGHLRRILELRWGAAGWGARAAQLSRFGGEAAPVVDRAGGRPNETANLPRLERYAAAGGRIEEVVHSADHDV